ncbi:hypothetical protein [uncultured Cetobacterium sp.]|uniref:hypothetical protein n=1 Tax=uncultured Cetobacterium sp. TaxID=527638 RepID=UPI0026194E79|nr:hypothetical protein [uncultured Cetobacterium sp.]
MKNVELNNLRQESIMTLETVKKQYEKTFSKIFDILKVGRIILDEKIVLEAEGKKIFIDCFQKEEECIYIFDTEGTMYELLNITSLETQCILIEKICVETTRVA